jgi:hypothetical protein
MSKSLKKKNYSQEEDIEMSPVNETKVQDNQSSNEIIVADSSLRNLYQLGYNSRSLTKTVINSIKFHSVVENIKCYLNNNELSVKAAGPLLLGLTRVYEKQIKNLNEELTLMFQIKRGEKADPKENKANDKMTKSKIKKINLDSTEENSASVISQSTSKSFFNAGMGLSRGTGNSSMNNILSLSPLNEGLFSLLNKDKDSDKQKSELMTPSRFLQSESMNRSPNTAGIFRAQSEFSNTASKNKLDLNMINSNSNFKNSNMILEKSIFEEENQDINNFYQFISNNAKDLLNENTDLNREDNDYNTGLDLNYDLNLNLNVTDPKTEDLAKQLVFNSDSKSLLNLNNLTMANNNSTQPVNLKVKSRKIPVNTKLEYDEDVEMIPENIFEEDQKEEEVLYKFRNRAKEQMTDFNYLLQEKSVINTLNSQFNPLHANQYLNKENSKLESISKLHQQEPDESLIHNFSNLDFKDFGLKEDNYLKEKLNKILEEEKREEEEKNSKEENKFEQEQDDFQQGMDDLNHQPNFDDNFNNIPDGDQKLEYFKNSVLDILQTEKLPTSSRKKNAGNEITFTKLTKKMETEFPPHQVFYNLLCLAQKENNLINLNQEKVFKNEAIKISQI